MGAVRAFLFAPSKAERHAHLAAVERFLPALPDAALMESAYRYSGARTASFAFAQGAIVGALGNLFASGLGHFIDRAAGPARWPDVAWAAIAVASILGIALSTWGALLRYRLNTQVELRFLAELRRRGVPGTDLAEDEERGAP